LCFITRLSKNDHVYEWTDPFLFFLLRRCECNTSMQSLVNNLTDGRINDICPNTYKSYSLVGIVKTHKILSYMKICNLGVEFPFLLGKNIVPPFPHKVEWSVHLNINNWTKRIKSRMLVNPRSSLKKFTWHQGVVW
jgi:hypothetical protein